jgi:hypothetical protein
VRPVTDGPVHELLPPVPFRGCLVRGPLEARPLS